MFSEDNGDRKILCKDCGRRFWFSVKEQDFYAGNGWGDPKRCFDCRKKKKV